MIFLVIIGLIVMGSIMNGISSSTKTPTTTGSTSSAVTTPPVKETREGLLIAAEAIRYADHPCPRVTTAVELQDGSIRAICSNNETYRIMTKTVNGKRLAMRCSAGARLGVTGC